MDCRIVRNSLSEFIDGALPDHDLRNMEGHISACDACQVLKLDLTEIRVAAGELPLHTPPRAMWARIQREIEAGETKAPARAGWFSQWWQDLTSRDFTFRLPQMAGAGVLALALMGTGLYGAYRQGQGNNPTALTSAVRASVLPEEESIQKQINVLNDEIGARRHAWDANLVKLFDKQLARIQRSREECRQKLVASPADGEQRQMLLDLYHEEIELLETFARIK
ncbi:MAG: zf-HC2 domain-containing protein [Blastocatellia bacterium]